MIHKTDPYKNHHSPDDDQVLPFAIYPLNVRGRIVRLGPVLDHILKRHDYPDPVSHLLAETIILTLLFATSLDSSKRFTLQTRTDGPVSMLVCDFTPPSSLRAYALFNKEKLQEILDHNPNETPPSAISAALLGSGMMALTIYQTTDGHHYQTIIPLKDSTIEQAANLFFVQSVQILTKLRISVARVYQRNCHNELEKNWRAGGILVQFLPDDAMEHNREPNNVRDHKQMADNPLLWAENNRIPDQWQEASALTATVEDAELTDPQLKAETLLYRLFHEHGVTVADPLKIMDCCSCSQDKIGEIIKLFSPEELAETAKDGKISIRCEFCSKAYIFET